MRLILKRFIQLLLIAAVLWGAWFLAQRAGIAPLSYQDFIQKADYQLGALDPEGYTVHGGPLLDGLNMPGDQGLQYLSRLNDPRLSADTARWKLAKGLLNTLQGYDPENLSEVEQKAYPQVRRYLERLAHKNAPYSQFGLLNIPDGAIYQTPFRLAYAHPVKNRDQAQAYLARMRRLGPKIDTWIKSLRNQKAGIPSPSLRQAAVFCQRLANTPSRKHPLYRTFATRMVRAGENRITQTEAIELLDRVASILDERIGPAYGRMGEALEAILEQNIETTISLEEAVVFEGGEPFDKAQLIAQLESELAALDTLIQVSGKASDFSPNYTAALRDTLQLMVDDLGKKSQGMFLNVPAIRTVEIELQDSLFQAMGQAYVYLPGDLADTRKAKLFVHPEQLANVQTNGRTHLIHAAMPGLHWHVWNKRSNKTRSRLGRTFQIPAHDGGWQLYAAHIANEISLNVTSLGPVKGYPEGKNMYFRRKALAISLALAEIKFGQDEQAVIQYVSAKTKLTPSEAELFVNQALSRPGLSLASWQYYQQLLKKRAVAESQEGFYMAEFHEGLLR
ncbi:MAG: DUF885 family protein [Bacteroidia bacterium]